MRFCGTHGLAKDAGSGKRECPECRTIYMKAYRLKWASKRKEYTAAYYRENREGLLEYRKLMYQIKKGKV